MSITHKSSLLWIVNILLLSCILTGCSTQTQPQPTLTGNLPISAPSTIIAGEPVSITVGPIVVSNGIAGTLIAAGSYGLRIYQSSFQHGKATFRLPGKETQQSGVVTLTARAGQAQGTSQLLIQPSPPVEPLTPLIGARAIIADAEHWSMTVLIPFDAFGNPVMEGTKVEVLILHPGNRLEKKFLVVHNLLAWTRVFSGTRAGRTLIVAQIGQVHGYEGTLLEVAGWPVPFTISANPPSLSADGRLLTTLTTSVIQDKFGNVIPDGTLITFTIQAPDGSFSTLPSYVIYGVAQVSLQAPRVPGIYKVQADVLGVDSVPLLLTFTPGPAVNAFSLTVQKDAVNSAYLLQAGPLLGPLGQYIPDNTPVNFSITSSSGQTQQLSGTSIAGYVDVELLTAQFPPGAYSVQVIVGARQTTFKLVLK